ncbi:unnamed protein product, partial [Rotaria magnacalcarata]
IDENIPTREQAEYRLSAVPALPTIVEENPITLTPSDSNQNLTPSPSTTTASTAYANTLEYQY